MAAHREQVIGNPSELGEQHAQILAAQRHFEIKQLFDGQHETVLFAHWRNIIEPVEIGQRLKIGLVFDEFFGAAVQQPDMRIDAFDDLAIQLQNEPQYAVRRRMLRTEIDGVVVNCDVAGCRVGLFVRIEKLILNHAPVSHRSMARPRRCSHFQIGAVPAEPCNSPACSLRKCG